MFTTLADGNINIEMISQGASEINISCGASQNNSRKARALANLCLAFATVINKKDAIKALNLVHRSCLCIAPAAVPYTNGAGM